LRAGKVSFTALERQVTVDALRGTVEFGKGPRLRAAQSVIDKLEKSTKPKPAKATGLSATVAVEAFKDVLGSRLLAPLPNAQGVWMGIGRRLAALGVSRMDCVAMAKSAAVLWPKGRIKAESIVRNAELLLSDVQQELPGTVEASEMDDL
jgi:hypothetical protein